MKLLRSVAGVAGPVLGWGPLPAIAPHSPVKTAGHEWSSSTAAPWAGQASPGVITRDPPVPLPSVC
jgi:hypothetical protein